MLEGDYDEVLEVARRVAADWLEGLSARPVGAAAGAVEIHAAVDGLVPAEGVDGAAALEQLAAVIGPGLAATGSGRYFGFVNGGALPAALGADWLVSAWDQNAPFVEPYPGAAAIEQVAGRWVLELLGLPAGAAVGFVTGAQMANTTCLAAARNRVLEAHGHDVEVEGLIGAPPVTVIVGAERHSTVGRSLRLLGFGSGGVVEVPADDAGRMDAAALAEVLASADGPTIVCAQAGNVNGGAFDPLADIVTAVGERRPRAPGSIDDIWLHVDGAFGLWVRAAPAYAALAAGVEGADSWATDAHKWLNTPYDCGLAIVADAAPLRAAMALRAAYLPTPGSVVTDPSDRVPESSRRARGLVVWATIRSLGRAGVAELVERGCQRAAEFAELLRGHDGVAVMHAEINQLVVSFDDPAGADDDAHTDDVVTRVQQDGTCYLTGTRWKGRQAMRISVSNWRTDSRDVQRSVAVILAAHRRTSGAGR